MNLYEELDARGMVYQASEGLETVLAERTLTAYIGFDPTAASLHVGSLLPVMALVHLQRHGHSPIAIVGGGTGMIGDPGGKVQERPLLSREQIEHNVEGIRAQLERFLDFTTPTNPARLLNNADWLAPISLLDFLRDVGKHFTVNYMLAKESVERRIAQEEGISFTEFSYMLLQAYDFLTLYDRYGCTLQLGGSDQWGNIVMGVDLGRRMAGADLFAVTTPLIATSSGAKMGKSMAGAVWLNAERVSAYDFWQYWRNTEDADVGRFLKLFTEMPLDEIARLEALKGQEVNEAKKILATEITALAHGRKAAHEAAETARRTFEEGARADTLPTVSVPRARLAAGVAAFELLHEAGLAESRNEARKLIKGGGGRLNDKPIAGDTVMVGEADLDSSGTLKLSAGRKRHVLVRAV